MSTCVAVHPQGGGRYSKLDDADEERGDQDAERDHQHVSVHVQEPAGVMHSLSRVFALFWSCQLTTACYRIT